MGLLGQKCLLYMPGWTCVNICCSSVAQDVNKELLRWGKSSILATYRLFPRYQGVVTYMSLVDELAAGSSLSWRSGEAQDQVHHDLYFLYTFSVDNTNAD